MIVTLVILDYVLKWFPAHSDYDELPIFYPMWSNGYTYSCVVFGRSHEAWRMTRQGCTSIPG
jgi:hypothetical protein